MKEELRVTKSNVVDGVKVNIVREYSIYDLLPQPIRLILQNADDDYHVESAALFYVELRRRGNSLEYICYELRKRLQQ